MFSTVQIAEPVKPFDDQGQSDEQPYDQDTVGLMVAEVFHAITVLAVVETPILDLATALGHAIALDAHGGPVERFPRGEVISVPDLGSAVALLEDGLGWLTIQAASAANRGRFSLRHATAGGPTSSVLCKKGTVA